MQSNSINVCEICENDFVPTTENASRVCDECIAKEPKREAKAEDELQEHTKICHKSFELKSEVKEEHEATDTSERPCSFEICDIDIRTQNDSCTYMKQEYSENLLCTICHKSFGLKSDLEEHEATHSNESPCLHEICDKDFREQYDTCIYSKENYSEKLLSCTICNKGFSFANELKQHESICVTEKYEYDICKEAVEKKLSLRLHRRIEHEEKRFTCNICSKSFEFKKNLREHKAVHTNRRRYSCDKCDRCYKYQKNLRIHIREKHGNLIMCTMCNKRFLFASELKQHESICVNEQYECDMFKTTVVTEAGIRRHVRDTREEKRFACDICNKSFVFKKNLRVHEAAHLDAGRYSCDKCDRRYKYQKNLRFHLREKHGNLITCTMCDKRFLFAKELKQHELICEQYECDICKQKFKKKVCLKQHIRETHEEKRFTCDICKKSLKYKKNLRAHMAAHLNTRSYSCDKCDKCYKQRSHLRSHIRKKHVKPCVCTMCKKCFSFTNELNHHESICVNEKYECDVCKKTYGSKDCLRQHVRTTHEEKRYSCDTTRYSGILTVNICFVRHVTRDSRTKVSYKVMKLFTQMRDVTGAINVTYVRNVSPA